MMWLMDKGYYDYDYEKVEKLVTFESTQRSEEETRAMAKRFGFGVQEEPKQVSAEELQQIAINQNKEE